MRYLLVLWDGGGNVPPQLEIARQLVARGHRVRILTHRCLREQVAGTGAEFVRFRRIREHEARNPAKDLIKTWRARTPLGYLRRMRDHLMFGPAKALALDVLDALEQESADAMAVDFLMPGGLVAAEAAGVPAAAVVHTIYSLPAPGLAPVGMGLAAPQSALGRRGADLLNAIVAMLFNRRLKSFNQTRRELGLGPLTDSMQLYERAHRILVLTYRSFDFPASSYPANVRYVGPCLKPLPENDTGPCVDSYPVVASFSTNFADNARLVDRIHEVLSLLPHRCLLLTPAIDPDSIAEAANVDKSRFVPHEKVFPAAKVVITHGGHGTVIKALLHGLPVVCLPCDHDQSDIAQRLVSLEAGIRLSPRSTKRAIRNAVEKVLREEKFTQAARRAGDRFRLEEHPLAVEEIESL